MKKFKSKSLMIMGLTSCLLLSNVNILQATTTSKSSSSSSSSKSSTSSKPSSSTLSKSPISLSKPSTNTITPPTTTKPVTSNPSASQKIPVTQNTTIVNNYHSNTYTAMKPYSIPRSSYYYHGNYHPAYTPGWYSPYWYNPVYWSGRRAAPVATGIGSYIFGFILSGLIFFGVIGGLIWWFLKRKK